MNRKERELVFCIRQAVTDKPDLCLRGDYVSFLLGIIDKLDRKQKGSKKPKQGGDKNDKRDHRG